MKIKHLALAICFVWPTILPAQTGVYKALNQFLGTSFFQEFSELKKRAEDSVKDFNARYAHKYTEEEVQLLISYYNSSADRFNQVILNIRDDVLNKEVRKYMTAYPDKYAKEVEADLRRAREHYAETYQKELQNLTDGELTGVDFITLVPQIIKYGKIAIAIIKKIQVEVKKFNNTMLNKYLIDQYSFRKWEEIN